MIHYGFHMSVANSKTHETGLTSISAHISLGQDVSRRGELNSDIIQIVYSHYSRNAVQRCHQRAKNAEPTTQASIVSPNEGTPFPCAFAERPINACKRARKEKPKTSVNLNRTLSQKHAWPVPSKRTSTKTARHPAIQTSEIELHPRTTTSRRPSIAAQHRPSRDLPR